MIVWAVVLPIFWYTTLRTPQHDLPLPPSIKKVINKLAPHHTVVLIVWYLAIAGLILQAFCSYWSTPALGLGPTN